MSPTPQADDYQSVTGVHNPRIALYERMIAQNNEAIAHGQELIAENNARIEANDRFILRNRIGTGIMVVVLILHIVAFLRMNWRT
jgi:hypothetical protein